MSPRKKPVKVSRLITHHLSPEVLPQKADELATLLADNEMNLCKVAEACNAQQRAVRRWVSVARERGQDVLEMARMKLRARGVDPSTFPAERVRLGMGGALPTVSDRSDTVPKRGRGRPKKPVDEKDSPCKSAE